MTEKSVDELIADLWHFNPSPFSLPSHNEVESSHRPANELETPVSAVEDTASSKKRVGAKAKKCQHGKRFSLCKECGGEYLCHHGRVKRQCKLCGGASICVHMRRISLCRECGGSALCEHGRQKRQCKLCQVTTGLCLYCTVSSFDCNCDRQVCVRMAGKNNFVAIAPAVGCAITKSRSIFAKNAAEKV
jgi:hypothetical protein